MKHEEITQEQFNLVFSKVEKLPKNKDEYMQKLKQFYLIGRKDEYTETENNLILTIKKCMRGEL